MDLDPRTPVLVGAGQVLERPDPAVALTNRPEPVDLMARALEAAAEDCGPAGAGRRLLQRADTLRVMVPLSWRYTNPALLVAERLGIDPPEKARTPIGGNGPQSVASQTALAISRGEFDVALLAGAECTWTRVAVRRSGEQVVVAWTAQAPDTPEPVVLGEDRDPVTAVELACGIDRPLRAFPLFANALRAAAGRSFEEDAACVAGLWARFSAVAARNPDAWDRTARTAEELRTVGPDNRMVAFPYPKRMVANDRVDMGAALVMCSLAAARAAGVPAEQMVFPVAGADANDHWFLTHRADLCSSPAIRLAGARAFSLAGLGPDDVGTVDLYSCFPCAVQIGAAELGLATDDPARPLTVTGGLGFCGGPGNNYVTHALATVAGALRRGGGHALVTGLGWYMTKHAVGLWSADPPAGGFRWESAQADVDVLPQRTPASDASGEVTVETYTVVVDRAGEPDTGICALLTPEGHRTWAKVGDTATLEALMAEEGCGRPARLSPDGRLDLR